MAATPEEALATMIRNLKEKTGRTLDEWAGVANKSGRARHGEVVAFLKEEHGLGHGYANLVAQRVLKGESPAPEGEDLVTAQYSGPKAGMKPVYDALLLAVRRFGDDVQISPKKAYVSLRRSRQFGLIQPSTATRIDVGINLKGTRATARLEESGSFNSMVSHRVRVSGVTEVDKELIEWLRAAFDAA